MPDAESPATTASALTEQLIAMGWPRAYLRGDDGFLDLSTRPPGRGLWDYADNPVAGGQTLSLHLPREWADPPLGCSVYCQGGELDECHLWRHAIEADGEPEHLAMLPTWRGFEILRRLAELVS